VRDEYVSIDAMYRQVSLFTRKYAIFDEVGEVVEERHNHNRLNITEYLDRIRDQQGTFRGNVLVGSFNTGQLGLYLEPTVNFRGRTAIPRESVPNTMAFARDYWSPTDGLFFLSDYFEQFDHNGSGPQLTRLRVDNAEELAEDQGSYDVIDDISVRTQTRTYDDMTAGRTFRPSTFTTSMWLTEMGSNDITGR
jgi:hypothetical protein